MKLSKWNYKTHKYEDFDSPAVNPSLYETDMSKMVDCANCGKTLEFGDMYTSKTIHTEIGLGYGVCSNCYEKEIDEFRNDGKNL